VSALSRRGFEIVSGFVVLLRQTTERDCDIVLPRHVGQTPKMICSLATVGNVDHPCGTVRSGLPFLSFFRELVAASPIQVELTSSRILNL